jgi:hypothetical protein
MRFDLILSIDKEEAPADGGASRGFGFLDGGTLDGEGFPSLG